MLEKLQNKNSTVASWTKSYQLDFWNQNRLQKIEIPLYIFHGICIFSNQILTQDASYSSWNYQIVFS